MNAMTESTAPKASRVAPHVTRTFPTLIKRELWEHRGGFITAPIIVAAVFALIAIGSFISGQVAWNRARAGGFSATINGQEVTLGQTSLGDMLRNGSPSDFAQLGKVLDGIATGTLLLPLVVTGFVVAFYFANTLFDERKDRSVLFWKSMPVSDASTVWSKVATGLVASPLISLAIGLVLTLVIFAAGMVFVAVNGANPLQLLSHMNIALVAGRMLALLPAYMLTALCTAGWLLMCSAWARTKPVLWAFGVPALTGAGLSIAAGMGAIAPPEWYWKEVFTRLVLGTVFGVNISHHGVSVQSMAAGDPVVSLPLLALAQPGVWIAAAGILMILAAIRLRRWRDEA